MSTTKGVGLRRPHRQSNTPNVSPGCDVPISLVFRTHNEGLSKAAFLFCPKNFNLANPTTAASATAGAATSAASPNSLSGSAARHDTTSTSTANSKRLVPSTATTASASSTSAESVQTLVEAIVELRPFFPASHITSSSSTLNLTALSPASPLSASTAHLDQSPSAHSLLARAASSISLARNSYTDLMSLSSFASPSGGMTNTSFSFAANNNSGRFGERLVHAAVPPRGATAAAAAATAAGGVSASSAAGQGVSGTSSMNSSVAGSGSASGGAGNQGTGSGATGSSGNTGGNTGSGGASASSLMHPSGGWICRAMAFNEKEVSHANGAISVNQSLTSKCTLINEVAKGKIMARILPSYQDAQERYGLSHVELTVDNQYVSRSDLFLISEALRERILYEGEEIHVCSFRIRVREMLQAVVNAFAPTASSQAIPIATSSTASMLSGNAGGTAGVPSAPGGVGGNTTTNAGTASTAPPSAAAASAAAAAANTAGASTSYVRVGCGIVLPTTRINFQSLSPVHYVVVELAREMWDTTIDGRIALTWALRKFVSELLLKQLPKRKASPLIRVVFTGRLHKEFQFGRHSDVFHLLELPRETRNVDVVEEIRMHCEALVDRVLREVQTTAYAMLEAEVAAYREGRLGRGGLVESDGGVNSSPKGVPVSPSRTSSDVDGVFDDYVRHRQAYINAITAKRLFVHAKQSNTLEALSILLERCNHHYIDRHLTLCGHAVTIVSAGKGFYQVTNSLVQIVCARLHDMGLEKVHVVCIGRPPLHVTPLLEYTSDDDTLRSQYHLHSRVLSSTAARGYNGNGGGNAAAAVERYYETPEWMSVFFFHSTLNNNGGEAVFELLPKECWQRAHPMLAVLDTMWAAPEMLPPFQTVTAAGGEAERSLAGGQRGAAGAAGEEAGQDGPSVPDGRGGERQRGGAAASQLDVSGGAATTAPQEYRMASSNTLSTNPPLLIPGLGLRSYPVPEVTLPVPYTPAALADFDAHGDGPGGYVEDGNPMEAGSVSQPRASRAAGLPDVLEMSATASHATDPITAPTSPFNLHSHAYHSTHVGMQRSTSASGGRVSPIFAAGGVASSPLLVRTTTASSSVFASPNVPGRGSMPRAGLHNAAAWREPPHPLRGLNSSHSASQAHLGPPPHPVSAGAVPPLQRLNGGGGVGLRRSETSAPGSVQRHLRGAGSSGSGATGVAAHRLPLYASSSSIAVSTVGPGASGSRHSHPNSLTSYSTSSHPALHMSRSFDYKTTANPAYHSLGNFERSVRSAGSSYAGGRHNASSRLQARSLLAGEGCASKLASMNSVTGHASGASAAAAAAGVAGVRGGGCAALANTHRVAAQPPEGGTFTVGITGPAAVCSWYCLHAAKLHQDGGNGFTSTSAGGVSGGGAGPGGRAGVAAAKGGTTPSNSALARVPPRSFDDGLAGFEAAATGSGQTAFVSPTVGLPAVLIAAKPWHKALTQTRSDAVFCGCNVVDSDLRNGYLILEVTIDVVALPGCFWAPRLIIDDQGWSELMSCFTGRDDRLTVDVNSEVSSDDETEGENSMTIGGDSSTDGFFGAAPPSTSPPLRADGLASRSNGDSGDAEAAAATAAPMTGASKGDEGGTHTRTSHHQRPNAGHSAGSGTGEVYRFQSDFRAVEVFCRSHSGISADGRTLVLPTHNNSVLFKSSEEILLCLQPHLFVAAADEGGDAALERRGPISPTTSHHLREAVDGEDGDEDRGISATETSVMARSDTYASVAESVSSLIQPAGMSKAASSEGAESRSVPLSAPVDSGAGPVPTTTRDTTRDSPAAMRASPKADERDRAVGKVDGTRRQRDSRGPESAFPAVVVGGAAGAAQTASGTGVTSARDAPHPSCTTALSPTNGSSVECAGVDVVPPRSSSEVKAPGTRMSAASTGAAVAGVSIRPVPLQLPPAPVVTHAPGLVLPPSSAHTHSPLRHDVDAAMVQQKTSAQALSSPSRAPHAPSAPAAPAHGAMGLAGASAVITVGFVQLRNSLLFAIKPINPLRPGAEEDLREDVTALSQSAESASTATVLRRRWQWKHPDIASEPPHLASWTRLCTCRQLPLYGSKPAYPREGFYTVSPHQYTVTNPSTTGGHADAAGERKRLLEFVLQRLQQQYQIVVDAPGLAAGAQWPRADPSPNARLEMSLGHQTHTLKVGETAKTISVTRMLHRGMYSNGQVTHMLSYRYLLWNYLADEFDTREVHMEAQVGERNAFRWESLDRWLQERPEAYIPRGPDLWLRSREVAVMLLPEDPAHPPSFEEFYRFIGYRFSVHLSTHGKVEWRQHNSGLTMDISDTPPLSFPAAPSLMEVVLVHDNPQTLDTRNVMDRVTGRTVAFEIPVEERHMSVDVSLPKQYDTHCCYFLKVSWLVCAASLVVDWFGSFIANASRFHLHAVPISCYYNSPKAESLTAHYDVEAASLEEEPALRRVLTELLLSPAYRYYPDTPVVTRNCRLVHLSGLCCVVLPPSTTMVAQWYQNSCLRQGSVEQLELLVQFKEAEAQARRRVVAMQGGASLS